MTYKTMKKKGSASRNIGMRNIFIFRSSPYKTSSSRPQSPGFKREKRQVAGCKFSYFVLFFLIPTYARWKCSRLASSVRSPDSYEPNIRNGTPLKKCVRNAVLATRVGLVHEFTSSFDCFVMIVCMNLDLDHDV